MAEKKSLFDKIRDVLVQEDNPNSPHLLFSRMHENIQSGSDGAFQPPAQEKHDKETVTATIVESNDKDKRRKQLFSENNFERLMWGDEK